MRDRTLFSGVFLTALGTLLFEVSLIRVLSFSIWYHFAYVVMSTALLGFGASGTLLAVRPKLGTDNLSRTLARLAIAAGVTAALSLLFISRFPLHPLRILEDRTQLLLLLVYQLVATVPFFFAGTIISLAFRQAATRVDRLYFWDLVGGGLACALVVPLMNAMTPPAVVLLASACLTAAAIAFATSRLPAVVAMLVATALLLAAPFGARLTFVPAGSKHLAMAFGKWKMTPHSSDWSALFRTDVVERSADTTFARTDEWGLGPRAEWPVQTPWGFIMHDGTAGTPLYDLREGKLDYLEKHILSLPYRVVTPNPRVLIIGVGGGRDVVVAKRFGARHVTGIELDPLTVELIQNRLHVINDRFFEDPSIQLVAGEGRHFVRRTTQKYDLVQMTGVDTLAATTSGAYVLAENYLYTVEAFHDYLDRLAPGGLLSVATGLFNYEKPRSAARMVNIVRETLRERGVEDPSAHIVVVHSQLLFAEVMVKNEPFTAKEIETLSLNCLGAGYLPLHLGDEGLPLWKTLVGPDSDERNSLIEDQPYRIEAIRDNSPFFFNFFRWKDLAQTKDLGPTHTTALGQIVLVLLLVSLTVFGALFVIVPLFFMRRRALRGVGRPALGILLYFFSVGLGFMLFEVSLMQQMVMFLGYPTYALSVVLFTLLTFLGVGSFLSKRFVGREARALPAAVGVIFGLMLFYSYVFPSIAESTLSASLAVRVGITVLALAPLGLTLGLFVPLGIRRAESLHRDLVPWAWGVNGCASVTATVLAVVLGMAYGFRVVWGLSVAIYAFGVAALLLLGGTNSPARAAAGKS